MSHAAKFPCLDLWEDGIGTGAEHMAMDEAMLHTAERPLLRSYRWAEPEVSFGYPMRWQEIESTTGSRPAVRRWTGGGIVPHGSDLTLALVVPAKDGRGTLPAFYERVHGAIASALGPDFRLAAANDCSRGAACFENPACFDVLRNETKIVGGAIRRGRAGTLYQGSIQAVKIPVNFLPRLAAHLAETFGEFTPSSELTTMAAHLRASRYATREWLLKR